MCVAAPSTLPLSLGAQRPEEEERGGDEEEALLFVLVARFSPILSLPAFSSDHFYVISRSILSTVIINPPTSSSISSPIAQPIDFSSLPLSTHPFSSSSSSSSSSFSLAKIMGLLRRRRQPQSFRQGENLWLVAVLLSLPVLSPPSPPPPPSAADGPRGKKSRRMRVTHPRPLVLQEGGGGTLSLLALLLCVS